MFDSKESKYMLRSTMFHGFLLSLAFAGCSRTAEKSKKVADTWQRGDMVVVEATAADFFESQVLEVKAGQLKVQRPRVGENLLVNAGDTYRVPSVPPRLGLGAWAICQLRPHEWQACRISRVVQKAAAVAADAGTGEGFEWVWGVLDAEGREHELRGTSVIVEPTGLTAMNIQRRFDQLSRRANFQSAFQGGGKPRRPATWRVAPNRMVLANREGQWFGAQVVEIDAERVVVRWDGQKGLTDLSKDEVSPQPPACGVVIRGDRALRRPSGHGGAWIPVAVASVEGADATVEDVERSRLVLQTRDLCPFEPGQPTSGN